MSLSGHRQKSCALVGVGFSVAFVPVHIGDYVYMGEDSVVIAAQIGSYVHIGRNCVVGRRSILKDACAIADDAVLAADTVVPPFAVMAGSPGSRLPAPPGPSPRLASPGQLTMTERLFFVLARIVGELPDCSQELMIDALRSFYQHFIPEQPNT